MTFMEKTIVNSLPLWEEAANTTFLQEIGENTLDKQQFLDYIVQDSIYLRDYLKAYAMAIFKSKSWKEMQVFCSVLGFVNDSENASRLKYLADNGMTDEDVEKAQKTPACRDYTQFLIDTATSEDIPEILMAVMPCMLGYRDVFKSLIEKFPCVFNTYFGPLVADYTTDAYGENCETWTNYCNDVCENLDEKRKEKLTEIFKTASKHELYFWEMAGNKND